MNASARDPSPRRDHAVAVAPESQEIATGLARLAPLIFETSRDAHLVTDRAGMILRSNVAARHLLGMGEGALNGKPVTMFVALSDRPELRRTMSRGIAGGGPTTLRAQLRPRGGGVVHVELSLATADVRDHEPLLFWTARDLTIDDDARQERSQLVRRGGGYREVTRVLQEALWPADLDAPGLDVGVRCVAFEESAPAGGDFYDWQSLPDGSVHLALVDVTGKGMRRLKDALLLTQTLKVLALQGCELEDILAECEALVSQQQPDLTATAIVARYVPGTGRLLVTSAGHPPPLVVRRSSASRYLAFGGRPLGMGVRPAPPEEIRLELGDCAIFFTDGLIEGTGDIDAGLAWLQAAVASLRSDDADDAVDSDGSRLEASALSAGLVELAERSHGRRDDMLALVLRRATEARTAGARSHRLPDRDGRDDVRQPSFTHRLGLSPAAVIETRHRFERWVQSKAVHPAVVSDLLVIVSELCSNAVEAARSYAEMTGRLDGEQVVIEVRDDGPGLPDPRLPTVDDAGGVGGWGLLLVRELSDEMHVITGATGSLVRCVKRAVPLRNPPPG